MLRLIRPPSPAKTCLRAGIAVLLASVASLGIAVAQEQTGGTLRGGQSPYAVDPLAPATSISRADQTVYVPTSAADSDEDGEDRQASTDLFAPPPDDTFQGAPLPEPRRPSTAVERRRAQANAEAEPPIDQEIAPGEDPLVSERIGPVTDPELLPLDPGAERAGSIEGRDLPEEEDPFAPVGIRMGTFILRPSVEQGVTVTTNAANSTNGRAGVLSDTTLRLNAISDWSRHSASLDAYGTFRRSLSGEEIKEVRGGVDAVLDLDLGEDLSARATLGYQRRPESASSPVVIEGTLEQPILQEFSGSLGVTRDLGDARFGVTGRVERDLYGDADLSTGGSLSQAERDNTLYTLLMRAGYAVSPALRPFVEGEIGRRVYDQEVDTNGFRRSSDRLGIRGGVELDLSEKVTGEVSAGWLRESFDDDRLRSVSGPTIDANLRWSPVRGTVVGLNANTSVEGSTSANESGSVLHSATLSVEHRIRADLTATAAIGGGYRDYAGSGANDRLFNAELSTTWWMNRYTGLTGRLRHESLTSSLPFRDYDANSVFVGLKLQR
jgi:hypothetical protein